MEETIFYRTLKQVLKPEEIKVLDGMVQYSHLQRGVSFEISDENLKNVEAMLKKSAPGLDSIKSIKELSDHIKTARTRHVLLKKSLNLGERKKFNELIKSGFIPNMLKVNRETARIVRKLHESGII